MPSDILKLPLEIQLVLAGGYAAYLLSYIGIRQHHTAIDTAFLTLVFGLSASAVYALSHEHVGTILSASIAFVACCSVGLFWRRFGQKWTWALVKHLDLSWSNDEPSAWASLLANTDCAVSQVAVLLDDGTWLQCKDLSAFANSSFGPCKLGPSGDIALYVTHIKKAGEDEREQGDIISQDYGDLLTFIPASKIKYVTMRHKK